MVNKINPDDISQVEYVLDTVKLNDDELKYLQKASRLYTACKLYELGKVTQGEGAKIAGISKIEFIYELGKHGVSVINAPLAELEKEFDAAIKLAKEFVNDQK